MHTILLVVDGTDASESAVREAVREARHGAVGAIHLLNVQPSFDGLVRHFVGGDAVRAYQRDASAAALTPARRILDRAGLEYEVHVRSGDPAREIPRLAKELRVDQLVLSSDGDGMVESFLQRLLVGRLIRRSSVPVVVVRAHGPECDLSLTPPPTLAA